MSSNAVDWERVAPELAERESLYRTIFQATSDGIAIWNLEGEVVEVNPAICRMHGYSEAEFLALPVAAHVHPDYHETRRRFMQRVRAGESFRIRALDVRKDGSVFPVDVLGIPVTFRGGPHVVSVMRDISDQVEAEDTLGQRVEERTRELSALLAISRAAASNFDLRTIVRTVLGHVRDLVAYHGASLSIVDGDFLVEYFADGVVSGETERHHDTRQMSARWSRLSRLETVIIPNTSDPDDENAREFQVEFARRGIVSPPPYCWLAVPLAIEDRITGLLVVQHGQPGFYTEQHAVLVRAVADQIALAIENTRLFADAQRRASELAALLAISRVTAASLDLPAAVDAILGHLGGLVEHSVAAIDIFDGEYLYEYQRGAPADTPPGRHAVAANPRRWARLSNLETVIIPDTGSEDDEMAEEIRANFRMRGEGGEMPTISWMAVPLAIEQRVVGLLVLNHETPGFYTQEHADLVGAVANQVALAIENARLFADAQRRASELAALLAISRVTAASLDLPTAVDAILGHLGGLVEHSGAAIDILDGDDLVEYPRGASRDESPRRYPVANSPKTSARTLNGETVIVSNTATDDELAQEFRERERLRGDYWSSSPIALMLVPLAIERRVIGLLALNHETPGFYTEQHAALARAASDQIALAIENARLFAETQASARDLSTLLELSQVVTSTLDLQELYEVVLDRLGDLISYTGANIGVTGPEGRRLVAARRPHGLGDHFVERPEEWQQSRFMSEFAAGRALLLSDVRGDDPLAIEYREYLLDPIDDTPLSYVRSLVCVPLLLKGKVIGELSVAHSTPGYFGPRHIELVSSVGGHVAIAIENARLFAESERRASELAALLAIAQAAAASLDLRSVVGTVLGRLRDLVEHDTAFILTLEGDDLVEHWGGGGEQPEPPRSYAIRDNPQRWARIAALETVIIADTSSDDELAVEQRESAIRAGAAERAETPMCWMGVPLAVERRIVGLLVLYHERPGYYTAQHAALARAVADQVALAVENARLFEQAQHAASLEERQRLARELHDSVSQALYGIALGARTALRRAERSPQDVAEPLEYVLSLSEAALTEMRALIFELRPESLETEGLVAALSRQAETMRARHGIAVVAELGEEPPLAMPAREALYRIAQEALHNVVKHAQAANVQLSLACGDGNVTLTVTDDGAGFDPEGDFSGHLGLRSMRERAAKSGGTLTITAAPGKGTTLRVSVPAG